jgi:hypothetical protein
MDYATRSGVSDIHVRTDGALIYCDGCPLSRRVSYVTSAKTSGPGQMLRHVEQHMHAGHAVPWQAVHQLSRLADGYTPASAQ